MGAIKSPSRRQSEQQTFIEMTNTLVMMQSNSGIALLDDWAGESTESHFRFCFSCWTTNAGFKNIFIRQNSKHCKCVTFVLN